MSNDENPSMAAHLTARRLAYKANVTLNKLCKEAGVDFTTVWRWRIGHTMPTEATLQKLEEASARLQKDNPFLNEAAE